MLTSSYWHVPKGRGWGAALALWLCSGMHVAQQFASISAVWTCRLQSCLGSGFFGCRVLNSSWRTMQVNTMVKEFKWDGSKAPSEHLLEVEPSALCVCTALIK
jgi:hypothetical protein